MFNKATAQICRGQMFQVSIKNIHCGLSLIGCVPCAAAGKTICCAPNLPQSTALGFSVSIQCYRFMAYIWLAYITLTTSKANYSHLPPITLAQNKSAAWLYQLSRPNPAKFSDESTTYLIPEVYTTINMDLNTRHKKAGQTLKLVTG
jgi:hypothetical protein